MTRHALVIGASRGIGLGLVREFRAQDWKVTATVRHPEQADALRAIGGVTVEPLELTDPVSLETLAARLHHMHFDLLLINAGIAGPAHHDATKATADEIAQLFLTNAIAPVRLAERLLPLVNPDTGVVAFMSSVMGSVTSGPGMGMPLYGASKAALNHLARNFALSLSKARLTVLLLHPGWVRTDMGGPDAPLDVATSCKGLVKTVTHAAGQGGHRFVDYQGHALPW